MVFENRTYHSTVDKEAGPTYFYLQNEYVPDADQEIACLYSQGFTPSTKGHSILKKKSYLKVAPTPRTPDFVDYSRPGNTMLVVSTARRKAVPIGE